MPQLLNQIRGERKLDKLTGLVRKMGPGTRGIFLLDVFSFRRLLAAAGICAFMACPAEPKLNLQPGYKVTFASRQGDTITCAAPLSDHLVVCALPDADKLACNESDIKGVLNHCGQRWKWGWLADSVSNRWPQPRRRRRKTSIPPSCGPLCTRLLSCRTTRQGWRSRWPGLRASRERKTFCWPTRLIQLPIRGGSLKPESFPSPSHGFRRASGREGNGSTVRI